MRPGWDIRLMPVFKSLTPANQSAPDEFSRTLFLILILQNHASVCSHHTESQTTTEEETLTTRVCECQGGGGSTILVTLMYLSWVCRAAGSEFKVCSMHKFEVCGQIRKAIPPHQGSNISDADPVTGTRVAAAPAACTWPYCALLMQTLSESFDLMAPAPEIWRIITFLSPFFHVFSNNF